MKNKPTFSSLKNANQGFTLILTISLLVLLTMIGIGLLTLSSVTLRSSSQANAQRIARDNARMAMMIAISQLQKHAGNDQRITAAADIAGDVGGISLTAGKAPVNNTSINNIAKGLTQVQNGSRFWTGVFANRDTSAQIFTRTPSPTLVQWLVSGNESTLPSATPATVSPVIANLPSNNLVSVNASGTISDATRAVVLAGQNTVGAAGANTIGNYVVAPLVKISTDAARTTTGRYAWWVGDEGVKAKINIPQLVTDNTRYASLAAQRRGWDSVTGFIGYPTPTSPTNATLPKLTTISQTSMMMPSVGVKVAGVSPLQSAFHSATADSFGLLVDTLNGGTQVDLHTILSATLPTTPRVATIGNYPVAGKNIISSQVARTMRAPTWDTLKEFYDRGKNLSSGALIVKAAKDEFSPSISPLITDFRLLMGLKFVPSGAGYKANPCGKIAIVIANPYSTQLKWNSDMEIEVRNSTPAGNRCSRIWNLGNNSVYVGNPGEEAVFNNTFFRIRSGVLEPGESRAYTVSGTTFRPQGTGTQRIVADLGPVASSNPLDFSYCVELDTPGVYTSFPGLDVRESWQTCTVDVDMKLAGGSGSAQSLCRLERFELDNGYFGSTIRNFTMAQCASFNQQPVGMMYYNFEISRPGTNYSLVMPGGYEMGQRSSTMRTFYDFNMHGTRFYKSVTSYNPAPFFMRSTASPADLPADGTTGQPFASNLAASPLPWGYSLSIGSPKMILFTSPTQFTSLAQFQHADLTGDDIAGSIGHQPAYAVGNSYSNPYVKRTLTQQSRNEYRIVGSPNTSGVKASDPITGATPQPRNYYDIAYLLNASLWDSYFLSALPASGAGSGYDSLTDNPAFIGTTPGTTTASLSDPVNAASQLMVDGAFNINSTDKNAWKAFLGSSKHFRHKSDTVTSSGAAFPRSLEQFTTATTPPTGTAADSFSGYRRLNDIELDALATEMVKQVRLRGPFVSRAHFVNRFIGDINRQAAVTRSGALQSAIDESGININLAGTKKSFTGLVALTDRVTLAEKNGAPRADLDGGDLSIPFPNDDPSFPDWANSSTDNNYGAVASIIADREMLNSLKTEQGFRSTAIPSWLTQADVLQVIGSSITPRSDTFRIRSYGEALDSAGNSIAKAYCECIVQRTPQYVDPTNVPTLRGTALSPLNRYYGRQFKIVSFRWLNAQEI
jgi:hypothetical protein